MSDFDFGMTPTQIPEGLKPGQIIKKEDFEAQQKLIAPPPLPPQPSPLPFPVSSDWWCVVFPATTMHHELARKLAGTKTGQLVPLNNDEMALLMEFMVWPKR